MNNLHCLHVNNSNKFYLNVLINGEDKGFFIDADTPGERSEMNSRASDVTVQSH